MESAKPKHGWIDHDPLTSSEKKTLSCILKKLDKDGMAIFPVEKKYFKKEYFENGGEAAIVITYKPEVLENGWLMFSMDWKGACWLSRFLRLNAYFALGSNDEAAKKIKEYLDSLDKRILASRQKFASRQKKKGAK
jgi:hypothetical protein